MEQSWRPPRNAVVLALVTLALGGIIGWATSAYFASEAMRIAVQEAEAAGRVRGIAQGNAEALTAFESTAPERLEAMFGEVFEGIRSEARQAGFAEGREAGLRQGAESGRREAFEEGYNLGFVDGDTAGFRRGFSDGVSSQLDIADEMASAERNWSAYARMLESLASLSRVPLNSFASSVPNLEAQQALISRAAAVVNVANTLREAHSDQASSFNSMIDELASAVEARDFLRIQEISLALEASSEAKGNIFLSAVKTALDQFLALRSN